MSAARCACSSRTTGWCGSLTGSAISPLLPAWVCEPSVLGSSLAIPHLLRYLQPTTGLRGQQTSAMSRHRLPLTPPHMVLPEKVMAPFAALSRSMTADFAEPACPQPFGMVRAYLDSPPISLLDAV